MPRAAVTVREGKSYSFRGYRFTETPSYVTDAKFIAELKGIGALKVVEESDDDLDKPSDRARAAAASTSASGSGDAPKVPKPDNGDDDHPRGRHGKK